MDWIGQALLYTVVRDAGLSALRKVLVSNSFDLELRLADQTSRAGVCQVLGLAPTVADVLLAQLRADPAYARLKQVREALEPSPAKWTAEASGPRNLHVEQVQAPGREVEVQPAADQLVPIAIVARRAEQVG